MSAVAAGAPPRGRPLALAAALALLALALHARVAGFALVYFDDATYLTDNPQVRAGLSWASASWACTTLHFGNWHPLTWLSWLLEVRLFGFQPAVFHLDNAILHALDAGLLLLALARLTGAPWRSALAAALFALHPLHVEAVAWASERKELLAALFGLLALLAYARHAARPSACRLALVALAFAASLAAKPMWVTLPALLLLLDLWPLGRWERSPPPEGGGEPPAGAQCGPAGPASPEAARLPLSALILEKAPLLLLSAASCAVTMLAQRRGGAVSGLELGLGARSANALVAYARYLGKVLWPAELSIYYPFPAGGLPTWQVAGAAALLVALSALAVLRARSRPALLLGWCWFLGTLVPVIGLVQVGGQALADRYMYLPAIGLWVAFSWGLERASRRPAWRLPARLVAAALLAACAAATSRQLDHWRDHEALFRHAIQLDPGNARAHGNLAYGLWRDGRRAEALDEARQAVALSGGGVREWVALGEMLREVGSHPEARRALGEAVKVNPRYAPAWSGLGAAEAELGRLDEAVAALEESLRLAPESAVAWKGLGELEAFRGHLPEAAAAFREALRLAPGDADVRARLDRIEGQDR